MEYEQLLPHREISCTMEPYISRTLLPYHKITFNFSWQYQYFDGQDSTPFHTDSCNTSDCVKFRGYLSYDNVREKVWNAIGDHLVDGERACFIEHVLMRKVRKDFPAYETPPKHTLCTLDFKIFIKQRGRFYIAESDDDYPASMVPAADASLGMLDSYEVGYDEESCCCICLEEDVGRRGQASLRMPCNHVFHDGCIKEWLRTSHYCPICRYEMPTE